MASSHSSRSEAELQGEKKVWLYTHTVLTDLCTTTKNTEGLTTNETTHVLKLPSDIFCFWSLPRWQNEGALHTLNVQLVLIGLLARFANLQLFSLWAVMAMVQCNTSCDNKVINKEIRREVLTFIPARDNMLLNLYCPDWTGVVYSNVSLN